MKEFLEERLRLVRSLAEKADPFTKRRLLELADSYEGRIGMTSKATRQLRQIDLSAGPQPVATIHVPRLGDAARTKS
jgi:hypothetical protein